MKIEMGKKYKTKSGFKVELIATDLSGNLPIAGVVMLSDGRKQVWHWNSDGKYMGVMQEDAELVEAHDISEGFTEWHGGKCPVADKVKVEAICRNGRKCRVLGLDLRWHWLNNDADIIAFRIIEPKLRPFTKDEFTPHRERWVVNRNNKGFGSILRCNWYDDIGIEVNKIGMTWNEFLNGYVFENGEPCGVLEND